MKQKRYTEEKVNTFTNFKKSILLVLTMGLFSMNSFATNHRAQGSELTVSMWERSAEFIVVLDGYQTRGQGVVSLDHIKPGKHYIKVIQLHRSRCSNERGKTLLHKGMINIAKNSKTTAVVKPRMGLRVVDVRPIYVQVNQNNHHSYHNHQHILANDMMHDEPYYGNNANCNECQMEQNQCSQCNPSVTSCGTVEPMYPLPTGEMSENFSNAQEIEEYDLYTQYMIDHDMYNDNSATMPSGYYGSYMSDYELEHLVKELEDAWFDSDRIKMAKRRIKAKKVTSAQVLEIIQQFSFESSRLEVAKFAYDYTIDQDNYYEVNAGFDFSSSINELEESIYH